MKITLFHECHYSFFEKKSRNTKKYVELFEIFMSNHVQARKQAKGEAINIANDSNTPHAANTAQSTCWLFVRAKVNHCCIRKSQDSSKNRETASHRVSAVHAVKYSQNFCYYYFHAVTSKRSIDYKNE